MTVVALDVGGSMVRGGLIARDGTIITQNTRHTADRDPGLRTIHQMAEGLVSKAEADGHQVRAIGAGFPEYVDRAGQLSSHETLDWGTQPRQLLAGLAPEVTIDSDVRCGALGELYARTDVRDFAYVSIGTGVSYALVCGGVIRRGVRGEAIALGELPVGDAGSNVESGSLEAYASGTGIARRYSDIAGKAVPNGARSVAALAEEGEPIAVAVLTSAGRALGRALAQLVALLDPGVLVLGGGLGTTEGIFRDAIQAEYAGRTARRPGAPPVETSVLGAAAGLIGAGHLAWSAASRNERDR